MKIAVKGDERQVEELSELLSANHEIVPLKITELKAYDLLFDLDFDVNDEFSEQYADLEDSVVLVGAVRKQLEQAEAELARKFKCTLIGMNSLPGFINRELMECTALSEEDRKRAQNRLEKAGIEASFVKSRVGMVSPRILCMIINEAFYTVQEGTAVPQDIDLGMKLGTAYPKGPFEWCELIGIHNVYTVLNALYEDTGDDRYKICSDLKTAYLKSLII
jgi:3-hydroxybutyryl-CoA dehydrogenase